MGRRLKPYTSKQLHVWVMQPQADELVRVAQLLDKSITDVVNEALAYWLAEQRKMGVK